MAFPGNVYGAGGLGAFPQDAQSAVQAVPGSAGMPMGASSDTQMLLGWWANTRNNMLSAVGPVPKASPATPQQLTSTPQGAMYVPDGVYVMPAAGGQQPPQPSSSSQQKAPGNPPLANAGCQTSVDKNLPSTTAFEPSPFIEMDINAMDSSQREFHSKLQMLRSKLLPELRARRSELYGALQSVDAQIAQVQHRCLEARRDGQAEFEALKAQLSSVENMKLAVLGRERDERAKLVQGIDETLKSIEGAATTSGEFGTVADRIRELHTKAQSLWSRSSSLPQVEVGIYDIPFEARAKTDKLRKFAVMNRLQYAKDVCLWHLELQRRQSANEALETGACLQHLESMLGRYAEELAFVCYFCADRFSASAANSRCLHNQSGRTSHPPAADSQVPSHVFGTGTHFWVPCSHGTGSRSGLNLPTGLHIPRLRDRVDDQVMMDVMSGPSRASTPPRGPPFWDVPPVVPSAAHPPWAADYAYANSSPHQSMDLLLRKIAQACERNGVDIRSAFSAFDSNGDGFISPQEFRHALAQLRIGASDDDAAWLVRGLDINADGMVSYEEFLSKNFNAARDPRIANVGAAFVEHFANHDAAAQSLWERVARVFRERGIPLRQAFSLFDADGDGVISRSEMLEAFRLMHLGLSESDVERMMRDMDVNDDGKVSIHEFVNRLA